MQRYSHLFKTQQTRSGSSRRARGQGGFTLLLAALVASITLALGSAIFQIAQKQVALSGMGRDSQLAFYAADTVAECALFWDFRHIFFAATTPPGVNPTCDEQVMFAVLPITAGAPYPFTKISDEMDLFKDVSPTGLGYCAQVFVTKTEDPVTLAVETLIRANGYSVNCNSIATSPRALQRSIELRY